MSQDRIKDLSKVLVFPDVAAFFREFLILSSRKGEIVGFKLLAGLGNSLPPLFANDHP